MVKHLPYSAGDVGSIPGRGTKIPLERLVQCRAATESARHNQAQKILRDAVKTPQSQING